MSRLPMKVSESAAVSTEAVSPACGAVSPMKSVAWSTVPFEGAAAKAMEGGAESAGNADASSSHVMETDDSS